MEPWTYKLKSRKFWLTIAVAIFGVANETFGWNFDPDSFYAIAAVVVGWVLTEGQLDKQRINSLQLQNVANAQIQAQSVANQANALLREKDAIIEELRKYPLHVVDNVIEGVDFGGDSPA
jgi:hypothetical protein